MSAIQAKVPSQGAASIEADSKSIGERMVDVGESLREYGLGKLVEAENHKHDSDEETSENTRAFVGGSVMMVARGIIVAVVALIVLSALYSTDIVSNPTEQNAWTNMTQTFADYGTTAFTLIGVGLIAVGAGTALAYFGGMGGGGR
jgi:hypothetical protein